MRQRFQNVKRSIKFDDESMTLAMDVKLSMDNQWERITVTDATISCNEREEHQKTESGARANPGGQVGRRALLLPGQETTFTRGGSGSGDPSGRGCEGDRYAEAGTGGSTGADPRGAEAKEARAAGGPNRACEIGPARI